jgi:hypothetical protein
MVVADREVRGVVHAAKARGEPFEPQDFRGAPDAAEEPNAVAFLFDADKAAGLSAADQTLGTAVLNGAAGPATPSQVSTPRERRQHRGGDRQELVRHGQQRREDERAPGRRDEEQRSQALAAIARQSV